MMLYPLLVLQQSSRPATVRRPVTPVEHRIAVKAANALLAKLNWPGPPLDRTSRSVGNPEVLNVDRFPSTYSVWLLCSAKPVPTLFSREKLIRDRMYYPPKGKRTLNTAEPWFRLGERYLKLVWPEAKLRRGWVELSRHQENASNIENWGNTASVVFLSPVQNGKAYVGEFIFDDMSRDLLAARLTPERRRLPDRPPGVLLP